MRSLDFGRSALCIGAAAALVAGCGGSQAPTAPQTNRAVDAASGRNKQVFEYTGGEQTFAVPSGVRHLRIAASGAGGAGFDETANSAGFVRATIPVTPGETLYVYVGGEGTISGGFNGGGNGGGCTIFCYGGGGASDVRQGGDALADRVVVAGGSGGSGGPSYPFGGIAGAGGGRFGSAGSQGGRYYNGGEGGRGGKQLQGGRGGRGATGVGCDQAKSGRAGKLGVGGDGGPGDCSGGSGGGGGGGYYGGGGGGGGSGKNSNETGGGGGGGGSSFIENGATRVMDRRGGGAWEANGEVVISW